MKAIISKNDGSVIDIIKSNDVKLNGLNENYIFIDITEDEKDLEVIPNHEDRFPMVSLTKLEFKNKLKELEIYTEAKAILDSLDEDKKEDWDLATCVDSDNEDILAVLSALNTSTIDVFYN